MPSASDSNARLDAIIDGRLALDDYERFLARSSSTDDYLFSEARARFEARDEDLLRAPADLRVVSSNSNHEVEIGSVSFGGRIGLAGLSRATVERLLPLIDGKRSYSELRELAGSDRGALARLVEGALGSLLFAPEAVAALEARISGAELVRFVEQALAALGYRPGPVDGHFEADTMRAIREFELDKGLVPKGRISAELIGQLTAPAAAKLSKR